MSGVGPISQDWEPVVLRKKAPTAAAKKDEKAVNAARRAGADIETQKKCSFPIPSMKKVNKSSKFCSSRVNCFANLNFFLRFHQFIVDILFIKSRI